MAAIADCTCYQSGVERSCVVDAYFRALRSARGGR